MNSQNADKIADRCRWWNCDKRRRKQVSFYVIHEVVHNCVSCNRSVAYEYTLYTNDRYCVAFCLLLQTFTTFINLKWFEIRMPRRRTGRLRNEIKMNYVFVDQSFCVDIDILCNARILYMYMKWVREWICCWAIRVIQAIPTKTTMIITIRAEDTKSNLFRSYVIQSVYDSEFVVSFVIDVIRITREPTRYMNF